MKRSIAMAVTGLIGVAAVGLYGLGWQLARPVPARIGSPPLDLRAESVAFSSESGSTIHGWLSRGKPGAGAVLLLPGVRANRLAMVDRARFLRRAGYSTLLIDFQATGESPGEAITFGWRERFDVIAAVQTFTRKVPDERIGIIGSSLGGAAALLAVPALDIQALVLEAVYPSLDVAVENRLRLRLGAAGVAFAPLMLIQLGPRLGISASDLRPVDHIAQLRCPILIIGGATDRHTTEADTRRLFAAAHEPKELWLVPDAAHVDYLEAATDAYRTRVLAFFERTLRNLQAATASGTVPTRTVSDSTP